MLLPNCLAAVMFVLAPSPTTACTSISISFSARRTCSCGFVSSHMVGEIIGHGDFQDDFSNTKRKICACVASVPSRGPAPRSTLPVNVQDIGSKSRPFFTAILSIIKTQSFSSSFCRWFNACSRSLDDTRENMS